MAWSSARFKTGWHCHWCRCLLSWSAWYFQSNWKWDPRLSWDLHLRLKFTCSYIKSYNAGNWWDSNGNWSGRLRTILLLNWSWGQVHHCLSVQISSFDFRKRKKRMCRYTLGQNELWTKRGITKLQGQASTLAIPSISQGFGKRLTLLVTKSCVLPETAMIWTSLLIVLPNQIPRVHCGDPFVILFKKPKTLSTKSAKRPVYILLAQSS